MKQTCWLKIILLILVGVWFTPFVQAESQQETITSNIKTPGVYIVSHEDIIRSGARNLSDVMALVPGIRISFNSSQSRPSSGPLVSSDSPTRLSAGHFSRILMCFNGHPLNKKWHGGADQEWGTGFLEGLKEIRIYTGPAALTKNGNFGAMDMVIDLIPFEGTEQKGALSFSLSQSINEDRLDKSLFHIDTGDQWGDNGHYSVFADITQWAGEDVTEGCPLMEDLSRIDRKDPTFQLGVLIKRRGLDIMARHLQQYHFDPDNCGRKWSYSFLEATHTFSFSPKCNLDVTASVDRIVSKWGAASSATAEKTGAWDKVTESRFMFRANLNRQFKATWLSLGADIEYFKIDGGPENSNDYYSVMNFSARRSRVGGAIRILHNLSGNWWFRGATRVEKAEGYSDVAFLPKLSVFYQDENTGYGLDATIGHRYMDTWYRVGSTYHIPDGMIPESLYYFNYIVPVELKPERNMQLNAWFQKKLKSAWEFQAGIFIGKYSHLMGLDWDFALDNLFNRLRAMEVGNYSYWGGSGSLLYHTTKLKIGANVSVQGILDAQLTDRQLYLSEDENQALYLAPVAANVFLDWMILRRLSLSARFFISGSAPNGGVDLESANFPTVFNSGIFEDVSSYSSLDMSLRLLNLWKRIELQLSVHNALNDHARLPMIEGGYLFSRGREIALTLRRHF